MSVTLSLPDRPVFGLSEGELLTYVDDLEVAMRRLAAARLQAHAEVCARGIPAARGYASPTAFLRERLKCHPGAAAQIHGMATTLASRPELSQIADALAKGAISEAQAAVITCAVKAITAEATPDQQAQAATVLLSHAAVLPPKELTVCGNRILHHVAPQTAEEHDRKTVEAAERNAHEARAFSLSPDGHGRVRLRGSTTAEGAALLHAVLDPLTHPRRYNGDTNGTGTSDTGDTGDTGAGGIGDSGAQASAAGGAGMENAAVPNAFRDPRSASQRRHDALLDALRLLLGTETLPESGGSKPQIAITVGFDPLLGQLGAGQLDTGAPLSPAEVRRLACDAAILPAILDGHSVPLDLGRERRLISGGLRKALIIRDRGCAFPGCDRPPRWCQGHHVRPWHAGGETCLASSVLLCSFHHALLHHDAGWTVFIGADGHPWFTAPTHLDPQQTPRRNLYHQRN